MAKEKKPAAQPELPLNALRNEFVAQGYGKAQALAAVELARKIFGTLRGHRAVILGAGQMSELALECLAGEGVDNVVVANRTARRGEALAAKTWNPRLGIVGRPGLQTAEPLVHIRGEAVASKLGGDGHKGQVVPHP